MTNLEDLNTKNEDLLRLNPELRELTGPVKVSKHRNVKERDPDGEVYDSGIEAADANKFAAAVRSGEYLVYRHHVPVKLPGGIRMVIDHMVVTKGFKVELYDSKAWDEKSGKYLITPDWRNKQKLFKDTFGFEIKII